MDPDTREKIPVSRTLHFLWQTAGRTRLLIFLLTLVQALLSSTGVLYALLLRELVDGAAAGSWQRFQEAARGFILVAITQLILAAGCRYLRELTGSDLETHHFLL